MTHSSLEERLSVDTAVEFKVINVFVCSTARPQEHSRGNVGVPHFRGKGGCLGRAMLSVGIASF